MTSIVPYECAGLGGQVVVKSLDQRICGDEVARPGLPRFQHLFLLELVQGLPLLHALFDHSQRFLKPFHVGADVVEVRNHTVPGNDLQVRRELGADRFERGDQTTHAAAARQVDKGKPILRKSSPMCTTFDLGKKMTLSPSVWPFS